MIVSCNEHRLAVSLLFDGDEVEIIRYLECKPMSDYDYNLETETEIETETETETEIESEKERTVLSVPRYGSNVGVALASGPDSCSFSSYLSFCVCTD